MDEHGQAWADLLAAGRDLGELEARKLVAERRLADASYRRRKLDRQIALLEQALAGRA